MAEDLQKVANEIVDNVLDGAESELVPAVCNVKSSPTKMEGASKRSLVCVMFCPNAWFNRLNMNPKGVLLVLLALTYVSLISVVAYASLLALTGTVAFRIYKNIIQAVQKTGDGHPFKEYLDMDVSLSPQKAQEVSQIAVAHINAAISELRRLFLVEDLVDSFKFGVFLWVLTYLGSWFNGMTLVIIAWVTLFTLPKVYEANQVQIDTNLEIVRIKIAEITTKVKAAIPIGKKGEKVE
ncbi:hypothetical protein HUJ04_009027 [Dendroctonus ponderosae]|nr:hypothetical protein HUJ04_009027 [Dendroctonus ponderosae]